MSLLFYTFYESSVQSMDAQLKLRHQLRTATVYQWNCLEHSPAKHT